MMATYIFVDTMIYLHFNRLDNIPLGSLLGDNEVTIVLTRVTVTELDSHKDTNSHQAIRDRARETLKQILHAVENGQPFYGYPLEYLSHIPSTAQIASDLVPNRNDDVFIASVLEYNRQNPDRTMAVLTDDTGLRLSCREHGIDSFDLDEKFRQPLPSDESVREIQRLRAENERLKSSFPRIEFGFASNGSKLLSYFNCTLPRTNSPSLDADAMRADLYAQCPEISKEQNDEEISTTHIRNPINKLGLESLRIAKELDLPVRRILTATEIGDKEYERYESERQEYFGDCDSYIKELMTFEQLISLSLDLRLEIRNVGRAPAEDVDVQAYFPDGFGLVELEHFPARPLPPKPPVPPRTSLQMLKEISRQNFPNFIPELPKFSPPRSFRLRETQSYEMSDHITRLKHGHSEHFPCLRCTFPSMEAAASFSIDYTITAANLPDARTGTLHVVIQKQN